MKKIGEFICRSRKLIIIISIVLLILSAIGMKMTKINYDILVYLPENIETIEGQKILTDDFNMGAYSIVVIDNMDSKNILKLEEDIRNVDGVIKVGSLYDAVGSTLPIEMLPTEIVEKIHKGNSDLLMITFDDSTSAESTINAVKEIREITSDNVKLGGMSSMVLDTMELSDKEIAIYILIAVMLCLLVLELALDSYVVPFILLINIGCAILFNLGSNIFLGQISYITKALVAVLQLGVTTDFSIFLYHSFEKKKQEYKDKDEAMTEAIKETFASVTGSSLTTIAGFLVLCTMQLTLGADLGIVMAKGVFLGVVSVLTLFPSLLLVCDKVIEKTKHRKVVPNFNGLNKFIIKNHIVIFVCFLLLLVPAYLAYSKVDVYYKIDKTLPNTLESIRTNEILKEDYNIVSPEIILMDKSLKNDDVIAMINELEKTDGIDFVLSFSKLKSLGITENMINEDLLKNFENDKYQVILFNSVYDIASDELNAQVDIVNDIVKKYDKNAIVAGEGPLMKDLIKVSDTDFNNVNVSSIVCIFIILFIILRSISLPFLLISAIEFAIFTNMGISYFGGVTLPFVAPIVLGTIQLGATIDYAILMTTTYLRKRKEGIAKNNAMLETLNECGISDFVSGMCFFAATFGVGMYSDLEMVGSLCTLISRGAIVSMISVITVLPSILLMFDKLVMKTTYRVLNKKNIRKDDKMKKGKMAKKATIGAMVFGILVCSNPVNALALTKNETVYSKLNYDGSVKNILVNEQLINNSKLDVLEDYSELSDILNISNDKTFTRNENKLSWDASGKDIFYQGKTEKNLPITTEITYKLDGRNMSVDDMLGKSGKVTISLKFKNNDIHIMSVNGLYETLYTPFIVTTGTIIDSENNNNISVTNGKVVSNGSKNVVVGITAPGLYESLNLSELKNMDTITITYDTTKFELASIYSVVTPKVLENNDLEIFKKLDNLYDQVYLLQNNMNKIDDGAKKVASGSNELKTKLASSIEALSSNTSSALNEEQIAMIKYQTVDTVRSTFTNEYKALIANNAWQQVSASMNPNDEEVVKIVTNSITNAVIEYLNSVGEYSDYVNCETGKAVMAQGGSMSVEQQASCGVILNDTALPYIQTAATSAASNTASHVATYVAENVSKQVAISIAEQTAETTAGSIAETLAPTVANQVKDASIESLTESLNTLYNGVDTLDNGISELTKGISQYNKEGINSISNLVNGTVRNTSEKIKVLTNLSNDYQSFDNKLSGTTGETKFILAVDSKKIPEKVIATEAKVEKTSLWDRIKNLFK